jgi:glycosyltransferase involved in cell wall biosynthesis
MNYKVVFYCPDRHISYNLETLEKTGVGGGITARIRMAHALAERGHEVTLAVNCPKEEIIQGVRYRHFSNPGNEKTDVFIATTSGGNLHLGELDLSAIESELKILMIHGVALPGGVKPEDFDFFYILSNFVKKGAVEHWGVQPQKTFVTHRGVVEEYFRKDIELERDPYALVYLGHPSKGLDTAIVLWRKLRQLDPRFCLHVFGGNRLWGGEEQTVAPEPGLEYHGLVGQHCLAQCLQRMSFSLNLQSREEPFGMAVIESMRAGCIVLASPVGAYPEIICHGGNGFLIAGLDSADETREKAALLIAELVGNPGYMEFIRRNALHFPLSWDTIAASWESHWNWLLERRGIQAGTTGGGLFRCVLCNGKMLLLADGLHCIECGNYQRSASLYSDP